MHSSSLFALCLLFLSACSLAAKGEGDGVSESLDSKLEHRGSSGQPQSCYVLIELEPFDFPEQSEWFSGCFLRNDLILTSYYAINSLVAGADAREERPAGQAEDGRRYRVYSPPYQLLLWRPKDHAFTLPATIARVSALYTPPGGGILYPRSAQVGISLVAIQLNRDIEGVDAATLPESGRPGTLKDEVSLSGASGRSCRGHIFSAPTFSPARALSFSTFVLTPDELRTYSLRDESGVRAILAFPEPILAQLFERYFITPSRSGLERNGQFLVSSGGLEMHDIGGPVHDRQGVLVGITAGFGRVQSSEDQVKGIAPRIVTHEHVRLDDDVVLRWIRSIPR